MSSNLTASAIIPEKKPPLAGRFFYAKQTGSVKPPLTWFAAPSILFVFWLEVLNARHHF
ncbi:MAG: hypothetical protein J5820_04940 [Rhodocyclaceae bacterium]|nr:hypothetical protein [Rhodocyclaceae bacterium]